MKLDLKPTLLDRAIGWISPERALRRVRARAGLQVLAAGQGQHDAARIEIKSLKNFQPSIGSADADDLPDRETMVARSRDATRNQPIGAGAVDNASNHVVGTGLRPQSEVEREGVPATPDQVVQFQRGAERVFSHWARRPHADGRRTQNFDGLCWLAFRTVLASGDCFAQFRFRRARTTPLRTCVHLHEGDLVSNPYELMDGGRLDNGNRVWGGVEKNPRGVPVAYHLADVHPGDLLERPSVWTRIPSVGSVGQPLMQHLFNPKRIGQSRGLPWLSPAIKTLKILSGYSENEATAALVNSFFSVFLKSPTALPFDQLLNTDGTSVKADPGEVNLAPGLVGELPPGYEVESVDPSRPNRDFEPFVMAQLREVGVALGIPVEVLVKHFQSSYSAARAALLDAWRFFFAQRAWLVSVLCQPSWEAVISEAVALGILDAPGFFEDVMIRDAWLQAKWTGPAPGQLDPLKENQAAALSIDTGISTIKEKTQEMTGGDFDRNHEQRAREHKLRSEAGLEPGTLGTSLKKPDEQEEAEIRKAQADADQAEAAAEDEDEGDPEGGEA